MAVTDSEEYFPGVDTDVFEASQVFNVDAVDWDPTVGLWATTRNGYGSPDDTIETILVTVTRTPMSEAIVPGKE